MGIAHRSAAKDLALGVFNHLNTTTFAYQSRLFRSFVPQNTTMPYVVIQNITENPGWECMGAPAKDCTFQLHSVSQQRGEAEAVDILTAAVAKVLDGWQGSTGTRMTVSNHSVGLVAYEGSDGFEDDIGGIETFHRVGRFRVQLCQST